MLVSFSNRRKTAVTLTPRRSLAASSKGKTSVIRSPKRWIIELLLLLELKCAASKCITAFWGCVKCQSRELRRLRLSHLQIKTLELIDLCLVDVSIEGQLAPPPFCTPNTVARKPLLRLSRHPLCPSPAPKVEKGHASGLGAAGGGEVGPL